MQRIVERAFLLACLARVEKILAQMYSGYMYMQASNDCA